MLSTLLKLGIHTIDPFPCNKITDEGLQYLEGERKRIFLFWVHTFNLSNCNNITKKRIEIFKRSL